MPRALTFLLLFVFLGSAGPVHAFKRIAVGDSVKDFTLETLDGKPLRLSESLGRKATLIVFWAGWSPRSSEALADFQRLYAEHGPGDLQVVAVDVAHQNWEPRELAKAEARLGDLQLGFPVAFDKDLAVFDAYGVIAVPSTVLADARGRVVALLEGYSHMTRDGFREEVLRVLGVAPEREAPAPVRSGYRPKGKAARYYQMGELLLRKEMPRKAAGVLERAVKEDPGYRDAYLRLAEALEADGRAEDAAAARERAAALAGAQTAPAEAGPEVFGPGGPAGARSKAERYRRMGELLLGRGQAEAAEAALRQALVEDPGDRAAYLSLGEALDSLGRGEEAAVVRKRAEALGEKGSEAVEGAAGVDRPTR